MRSAAGGYGVSSGAGGVSGSAGVSSFKAFAPASPARASTGGVSGYGEAADTGAGVSSLTYAGARLADATPAHMQPRVGSH